MKLPINHFLFESNRHVKQLISSLQPLGISFLTYYRLFSDGSAMFMHTHPDVMSDFLKNRYPVFNISNSNSSCYLARELYSDTILDEVSERTGVQNILCFHYVYEGFIEFFAFGSPVTTPLAQERLIASLNTFDNFNNYFRDTAADLIIAGEQSKVILPNEMLIFEDMNEINLFLSEDKKREIQHHLIRKQNWSFLSNREFDCLYYLAHGMQTKETADILGISARTVEVHLAQVRYKMNCRNKMELIRLYWTWQETKH